MSDARVLLEVRGASFGYRGRPVVSGVDLVVEAGAFLAILGPNGSGKSTLLGGLLGLVPPLAGTVVRSARAVGYVPQRETLDAAYPVTVEEVVHMGAYGRLAGLRFLPRAERELALDMLASVQLSDRKRAQFSELSGGQRQRALIARALMAQPDLLVLDEPTTGVDQPSQELILELLARKNRDEGLAVLLVSHEFGLTRRAVTRALWIDGGRVLHGDAQDILSPARIEKLFGGGA